jgi:hypothetical protein
MSEVIPSVEITIKTGARKRLFVSYEDDNGDPISMAGCTARSSLRDFADDSVSYDWECSCDENGITMVLPASVTADIAFANGVWDLFLDLPDGTPHCICNGIAIIDRSVTR